VKKITSSRQVAQRLWLALRLPDLPAHALGLELASPEPLAVIEKRHVYWINAAAEAAGIHPVVCSCSAVRRR
jgi:protein ImuB